MTYGFFARSESLAIQHIYGSQRHNYFPHVLVRYSFSIERWALSVRSKNKYIPFLDREVRNRSCRRGVCFPWAHLAITVGGIGLPHIVLNTLARSTGTLSMACNEWRFTGRGDSRVQKAQGTKLAELWLQSLRFRRCGLLREVWGREGSWAWARNPRISLPPCTAVSDARNATHCQNRTSLCLSKDSGPRNKDPRSYRMAVQGSTSFQPSSALLSSASLSPSTSSASGLNYSELCVNKYVQDLT